MFPVVTSLLFACPATPPMSPTLAPKLARAVSDVHVAMPKETVSAQSLPSTLKLERSESGDSALSDEPTGKVEADLDKFSFTIYTKKIPRHEKKRSAEAAKLATRESAVQAAVTWTPSSKRMKKNSGAAVGVTTSNNSIVSS